VLPNRIKRQHLHEQQQNGYTAYIRNLNASHSTGKAFNWDQTT